MRTSPIRSKNMRQKHEGCRLTASTRFTSVQSPLTCTIRHRWLVPARTTPVSAAPTRPASPFSPLGQARPAVTTGVVPLCARTRSAHRERWGLKWPSRLRKVALVAQFLGLPP
jgi:hypothetical protein